MFAHVDLKLLFSAPDLPVLVPLSQTIGAQAKKSHPEIPITKKHSAQMRYIADTISGAAHRVQKGDGADNHDEVFGLDGKQKTHQDDAVGVEHPEGEQQAVDTA